MSVRRTSITSFAGITAVARLVGSFTIARVLWFFALIVEFGTWIASLAGTVMIVRFVRSIVIAMLVAPRLGALVVPLGLHIQMSRQMIIWVALRSLGKTPTKFERVC